RQSPRFVAYVDYIFKALTNPEEKLAAVDGAIARGARGERLKDKPTYQMLPHARPGGIAGFLELLADRDGRDDLYRMADDLAMNVDDLLPIVEAAVLLGFATVREGDVEITSEGRSFGEGDIQTQKQVFREAALKHIAILKLIESTL